MPLFEVAVGNGKLDVDLSRLEVLASNLGLEAS